MATTLNLRKLRPVRFKQAEGVNSRVGRSAQQLEPAAPDLRAKNIELDSCAALLDKLFA
jgi:hypothetical protein